MVLHRYTSTELLELRPPVRVGSSGRILSAIEQNPDFAELHKKNHAHGLFTHARRSRSTREYTAASTDGEEQILFKGKRSLHAPSTQGEWRYRGRTDLQATTSEPISAPPGLVAQQSEGFKRFYKAVVSPSHVRVTASGRIVPNTRPSTSPTAKWDREASQSDDAEHPEPESTQKANINGIPAHVSLSPFIPPHLHHQYFQQMGIPMPLPMPMYPLPNGFPMAYGYPPLPQFAPFPPAQSSQSAVPGHMGSKSEADSQGAQGNERPDNRRLRPTQFKVAPPDATEPAPRPIVHSGQFMPPPPIPAYMPNPYFPAGWPGVAPLPNHRMPPMAHPTSAPVFTGTPGVFQLPSDESRKTSGASVHTAPLPRKASPPPLSSIKPSSVTKRQLDSLRSSLKFYEDQLAYNRHQIDEKATIERADSIRHQIAQFEGNLKLQQDFEAKHYPKDSSTATTHEGSNTALVSRRFGSSDSQYSASGSLSESNKSLNTNQSKSLRHPKSIDYLGHRLDRTRSGHIRGLNASSSANDESSSAALDALELHIQQKMESSMQGAVPSAAALAPSFLPVNPPSPPPSRGLKSVGDDGSHTRVPQPMPYLIGMTHEKSSVRAGQSHRAEYTYPRALTVVEKQAREVYWGHGSQRGTGLPKFDGKNFYPPSPTKPRANEGFMGVPKNNYPNGVTPESSQPAQSDKYNRCPEADVVIAKTRSRAKRWLSHAIPIVAPPDSLRSSTESKAIGSVVADNAHEDSGDTAQHSHDYTEAHVSKSTVGLWPNMVRNSSGGGIAAPSTVTSATAKGILPQYSGHAAASLAPSVSNHNLPAQQVSEKVNNIPKSPPPPEKIGENRPLRNPAAGPSEAVKEPHQRARRDGERREI